MIQRSIRERESCDLACLKAVVNLIGEAHQELSEFSFGGLSTDQLGSYREGGKYLRAKGTPVDDKDYHIHEISHPRRNLAYVKVGKGILFGETYILPVNNMDKIIESAFSPERIRKHYPYGIEQKTSQPSEPEYQI